MLRLLNAILLLLACSTINAQCINSFPYTEDFETGAGGWTAGGSVGNDWALGTPAKTVINQAGSGTQCWITGGLTTSFYNNGERSYVQSPCFDLTNLQHPFIAFKIFWESEKRYDGTNLQYSTNGGSAWNNVGAASDVTDCMNANWYNAYNINNLTGLASIPDGWAGNVQATQGGCQGGSGSGSWKIAKHCMNYLAGKPSVIFRFTFGAGTTCNDYDGIAFDSVSINEAPPIVANFTYQCNSTTAYAIDFTGTSNFCPDTLTWDFGDGQTGTGASTPHIYNTGGTYNVSFYAGGPCNQGSTVTSQVQVLGATAMADPSSCNSQNGKAFVTPTPTGSYTYLWNTSPAQTTDTAFNLVPSVYSVTVSAGGGCFATTSVAVTSVNNIAVSIAADSTDCNIANATATATVTTGTAPFAYAWSNGANTQSITGLGVGAYTVSVNDATGCSVAATATVGFATNLALEFNPIENESCFGNKDGKIAAVVTGGNAPFTYQWSNGSGATVISNLSAATYTLTITDASNCKVNDSVVLVKEHCQSYIYFPTAFSPNGDGANDLFRTKYSPDLQKFHMVIYNRWGEKVFETADPVDGWDGTYKNVPQPVSVFVWYSTYIFSNGVQHDQAGNITLMR